MMKEFPCRWDFAAPAPGGREDSMSSQQAFIKLLREAPPRLLSRSMQKTPRSAVRYYEEHFASRSAKAGALDVAKRWMETIRPHRVLAWGLPAVWMSALFAGNYDAIKYDDTTKVQLDRCS